MTQRMTVVGPLNIDLFIRGTAPVDAAALNEWVGPADVEMLVAGSVGYTVQDLALLGWEVSVVSTVGSDGFGAFIVEEMERRRVDTSFVVTAPGDTTMAIYMMLFGGVKRPMTYRLGQYEPWPDPIPSEALRGVDALHCGGLLHFPDMWHRSLVDAFASMRRGGLKTSLDPQFPLVETPPPWLPHIVDVLEHVDVLLVDEREGCALFNVLDVSQVIEAAHELGVSTVAVKRGSEGAVLSDGHMVLEQPAVDIDPASIRDAVGAGDAFDAGFLTALWRSHNLARAGRLATAAAALTLTGRGGSESLFSAEAVVTMAERVPPPRTIG